MEAGKRGRCRISGLTFGVAVAEASIACWRAARA
jgi:hypothetical protein